METNAAEKPSYTAYPKAPPIRSTTLRRALTLVATHLACRLGYTHGFNIVRISPKKCVKRSAYMDLAEAANMEYVRAHTTIPVPKVYCAFRRKGVTYIVMEHIRGETLWAAWSGASYSRREGFREQLKNMIQDLRAVPNPNSGQVAGPQGGPVFDDRYLSETGGSFGPFANAHAFHLWLRCDLNLPVTSDSQDWINDAEKMIRMQDRRDYPTILTHGDLNCNNIMVKRDRIAGIIDWGGAAWYPDYWEFTSAWQGNLFDRDFWRQEVENILEGSKYSEDLEMDQIRHRLFQPI